MFVIAIGVASALKLHERLEMVASPVFTPTGPMYQIGQPSNPCLGRVSKLGPHKLFGMNLGYPFLSDWNTIVESTLILVITSSSTLTWTPLRRLKRICIAL